MSKNKLYDEYKIGDELGSFVGNLRRAKYSNYGLTTQIFGENGENADHITALHLTKFLNVLIKVTIYGLKTSEGVSLQTADGKYPEITSFIATIKRPKSSDLGQTALFFTENGENADNANILNETKYVDALVLVVIQLADENLTIRDIKTEVSLNDLNIASEQLSRKEKIKLEKERAVNIEAEDFLIQRGFFLVEAIYKSLGSDSNYKKWVLTQPCCFNNSECDLSEIEAYPIVQGRPYQYIPICKNHKAKILSPENSEDLYKNMLNFLKIQKLNWVLSKIKSELGVKLEDPIPVNKMKNYLLEKGLTRYLPNDYHFFK